MTTSGREENNQSGTRIPPTVSLAEERIPTAGVVECPVDPPNNRFFISPSPGDFRYKEFQRYKHHPQVAAQLEGGECIAYGARTLNEGGYHALPKLTFPGGALLGCAAGFLNAVKIKGAHTAIKSGMLAAEAAFDVLQVKGESSKARCVHAYKCVHRVRVFVLCCFFLERCLVFFFWRVVVVFCLDSLSMAESSVIE